MYQLIELPKLLTGYAGLCAVLIIGIGLGFDLQGLEWLRYGSTTLTIVSLIVAVIGQSPIFPWLCRRPPLKWLFIDIDGEWSGANLSNWPRVESRDPNAALKPVGAKVRIEARLFHIKLWLVSEAKYSSSETLFVRICRADGIPQLIYTYRNRTINPLPTDEQTHLGSALLDIIGEGAEMRLKGPYWTNRNWYKGLNTAGELELRRA